MSALITTRSANCCLFIENSSSGCSWSDAELKFPQRSCSAKINDLMMQLGVKCICHVRTFGRINSTHRPYPILSPINFNSAFFRQESSSLSSVVVIPSAYITNQTFDERLLSEELTQQEKRRRKFH